MPETPQFPYDVFLSHNHADKPRVRRLAERLKAAGVRVWFDEWNIRSGEIIALKVDEGLEQSRVLLLCISPNALASGWVDLERSTAVHRDPANAGRRFIPLLLADCELPGTLRRYKYVDFRQEGPAAFAELLTDCSITPGTELRSAASPENRKTFFEKILSVWRPKFTSHPAAQIEEESIPINAPEHLQWRASLENKLVGHHGLVECVAFSMDGNWIASGSTDRTIKIWDLKTAQCRATLSELPHPVLSVAFTVDGKRILWTSAFSKGDKNKDKDVHIWDIGLGREVGRLSGHTWRVGFIAVLPNGNCAITGQYGGGGTLIFWDLALKRCVNSFSSTEVNATGSEAIMSMAAVNQAGDRLLSGHYNDDLRLWNLITKSLLATWKGYSRQLFAFKDDRFAVLVSGDRLIIWDSYRQERVITSEEHPSSIREIAVSADGGMIVSATFGAVYLFDTNSGNLLKLIEEEQLYLSVLVLSPDGSRLAVGTSDTVRIYNLGKVPLTAPK